MKYESDFQLGDVVESVDGLDGIPVGDRGVIVGIEGAGTPGLPTICLSLFAYNEGKYHTCGGRAADGHGWYVGPRYIKLIWRSL